MNLPLCHPPSDELWSTHARGRAGRCVAGWAKGHRPGAVSTTAPVRAAADGTRGCPGPNFLFRPYWDAAPPRSAGLPMVMGHSAYVK